MKASIIILIGAFFMSKKQVIGVFDSGVGGLTIWKEVVKLLPKEDTVYIADSENAPYGGKTSEEVQRLSEKNAQRLIDLGAKIIVVACNTATTQSIEQLRRQFKVPFIGIEPAVKPAALKSKTKVIGVLATNGTLESAHFNKTKANFSQGVKVITQVGAGLVSGIENGKLNDPELALILEKHLRELTKEPIDYLVLGCTHYPLLKPMLKQLLPSSVFVVDSGIAVALQTEKVLIAKGLKSNASRKGTHTLYSTGNMSVLKSIVKELKLPETLDIFYSSLYQSE